MPGVKVRQSRHRVRLVRVIGASEVEHLRATQQQLWPPPARPGQHRDYRDPPGDFDQPASISSATASGPPGQGVKRLFHWRCREPCGRGGTVARVSTSAAAAPHAHDHFLRRASLILRVSAAGGIAVRLIRSRMGSSPLIAARLMRQDGLAGRAPRRWKKTTIADPAAAARADAIRRDFTADASRENYTVNLTVLYTIQYHISHYILSIILYTITHHTYLLSIIIDIPTVITILNCYQ